MTEDPRTTTGLPRRPPEGWPIRPARPLDLDRVVEIEEISYSTPWSLDAFRGFLGRADVFFFVAESDGVLMGHGVLRGVLDEGELLNLTVDPRYRRLGVAAALLDHLIRSAAEAAVRSIFLEVRVSNLPARALYESRGFHRIGVRKHYYDRPREDALLLGRELSIR